MTTIEATRTLLAKESPELRRAVGEFVIYAMQESRKNHVSVQRNEKADDNYWACFACARELREDKGESNHG